MLWNRGFDDDWDGFDGGCEVVAGEGEGDAVDLEGCFEEGWKITGIASCTRFRLSFFLRVVVQAQRTCLRRRGGSAANRGRRFRRGAPLTSNAVACLLGTAAAQPPHNKPFTRQHSIRARPVHAMAATAHPVVPLSESPAHLTGDESTAASLRGTDSSEKDLEKKGEEGMEREKEEEGGQEKEQEGQQEVTYPDGGVAAWMNVLGSFLVMFATFGFSNSYVTSGRRKRAGVDARAQIRGLPE